MQKLLDPDKIRRHGWTDPLAVGIHKVDRHHLVLDQVVVEAHLLAILRHQLHVRQMATLDKLARGNVLETARWMVGGIMRCQQSSSCAGYYGGRSSNRQPAPPCKSRHNVPLTFVSHLPSPSSSPT